VTGRDPNAEAERGRRRLRAFMVHLAGYFAAVAALIALNQALDPGEPWFLLPMIGWGEVLALHAAHVMGLFDFLMGRR
jgi:hypothetical protein